MGDVFVVELRQVTQQERISLPQTQSKMGRHRATSKGWGLTKYITFAPHAQTNATGPPPTGVGRRPLSTMTTSYGVGTARAATSLQE